MANSKLQNKISTYLQQHLFIHNEIGSLFSRLSSSGEVILFGGAIRDILQNKPPRDYDFVFKASDNCNLETYFSNISFRKNRFGGYAFTLANHKFDLWQLDNTWAFKEKLVEKSEENLTRTVFLNFDSVALNLKTNTIYIDEYAEVLRKKELDIVLEKNPYPDLCVLRAFVFKKRNNLKFSLKLSNYIRNWLDQNGESLDKLWTAQHCHYKSIILNRDELLAEMQDIRTFCNERVG